MKMPLRRLWLILFAISSTFSQALVIPERISARQLGSDQEQQIWARSVHDSEFAAVPHTTQANCAATKPPQALATPNLLMDTPDDTSKVTVSFIIGTDGKVHSPLILESAGAEEDSTVLRTISAWRYRPATCNGVPTEAEARIGFSPR